MVTTESIEALVEMLVVRLVRTKLAQSVPVIGAALGAGFNVSTLHAVTKVARLSYHDRHLMRAAAPAIRALRIYFARYALIARAMLVF